MNVLLFIPILFCLIGLGNPGNHNFGSQLSGQIKGKWKTESLQVQYIVDSHLVHEKEISGQKGKEYYFDQTTVRVKYTDGTTDQGTYRILEEAGNKKVVLELNGNSITYTVISVSPTYLVWQQDLDDVTYKDGETQKAAERAIGTEVFYKVSNNPK